MKTKRVLYKYIVNASARKACLNRRRSSLINKVEEITKLCGVRAFIVIYSPDEQEPIFWPSRDDVVRIMHQFIQLPEMERNQKKMNQESYMKDKVKKLEDQVQQLCKRNREMEAHQLIQQMRMGGKTLNDFSATELNNLDEYAKEKLTMIQRRRRIALNIPSMSKLDKGKNLVQENRWSNNLDPWFMNTPRASDAATETTSDGDVLGHRIANMKEVARSEMSDSQASSSDDSGESCDPFAPYYKY